MPQTPNLTIAFPLYNNVTLVDFAGASEVFAKTPGFTVLWLGATMDKITTSENLHVVPNMTFDEAPAIDILYIPGGFNDGVQHSMFDPVYQGFLKKILQTDAWVGSVCTGAFILAVAGGLNDCTATTYWSLIPTLSLLKDKYNITVTNDYPRFIIDEQRKRFSGGGISSSLDLALELLSRIKGKTVAEETQLTIQYAPNPPVHAGDPTQASPLVVEQQLIAGAQANGQMYDIVMKLING